MEYQEPSLPSDFKDKDLQEQQKILNMYNIQMRHWASELATKVQKKELTEDEAYAKLLEHTKGWHQQDFWFDYLRKRLKLPTPVHAVEDILAFAREQLELYENRLKFPLCIPPAHHVLFLAMLTLGANGRLFIFARTAISTYLGRGYFPITISRFLANMHDHGYITMEVQGERFGSPTYYKLTQQYVKSWENLGKTLGYENAEPTKPEILSRFSWMFDKTNVCNAHC